MYLLNYSYTLPCAKKKFKLMFHIIPQNFMSEKSFIITLISM